MANKHLDEDYNKWKDKQYARRAEEDAVINPRYILEIAIQKSIDGGWIPMGVDMDWPNPAQSMAKEVIKLPEPIIFNHNFAKALWGNKNILHDLARPENVKDGTIADITYRICKASWDMLNKPTWQHHLQNMVIADDPIKYLGDNL